MLQFKDSVEVDGDKAGTVTLFLVTEPVQPLSTVLQELRLDGPQRCALREHGVTVAASHAAAHTGQRRLHCSRPQPGGAGGCVPEHRLQNGAVLALLCSALRP